MGYRCEPLVVSGGAERRRRTPRRSWRKVLEDVVVRRISINVASIFVEIFLIISSIRNVRQSQFSEYISNDYFVNKEYKTGSVFGVHMKLKISTQTSHMKSKLE